MDGHEGVERSRTGETLLSRFCFLLGWADLRGLIENLIADYRGGRRFSKNGTGMDPILN